MTKHLSAVLFAVLVSVFSFSQKITGTWSGDLQVGGFSLTVVININGLSADSITFDSPDQGAFGIQATEASFADNDFEVSFKSLNAVLNGKFLAEDDILDCNFSQSGKSIELVMRRGYTPKPKMQDPVDFPYIVEDIEIYNPETDVKLSGTLTAPYGYDCDRIVVLVSGSGSQDRNENIFGHKLFLVLSDYLTRNGIAVIRYDDRGFAKSTGDATNATTYDFMLDAQSVVKYIKNDDRLKNMKVGIAGHSEGGIIAPMLADIDDDVDFVVMLAGPAEEISKLMVQQNCDVMTSQGLSKEKAEQGAKLAGQLYAILKNEKLSVPEKRLLLAEKSKEIILFNNPNAENVDDEAVKNVDALMSPWYYYFINLNPKDYLCRTKVPVLALYGDKDVQVNSKMNIAAMNKHMKKAKNQNYRVEELPGINHIFQKCVFGGVQFYPKNKESFNEDAMRIIVEWIRDLKF
ncbi:MAG: alpha/beta hydrolase [Bacteroidales bacterium]|nr:alpha/beta hydrolase [Bacteroidales bacterium]